MSISIAGTSGEAAGAQGTQIPSFISGDNMKANIVIRLKPGKFDFWNSTLYKDYYIVPWIATGGTGVTSLIDYPSTDYFNPVEISNGCYEAFNNTMSYSSKLEPLAVMLSMALF